MDTQRQWLKVDEAARELQVSRTALYNWIAAKKFPVLRLGRHIRISRTVLEEMARRGLDELLARGNVQKLEVN